MESRVLTRFFLLALFLISCSSSLLHAQGGYALDFDGVDDYVNCGSIPFSSTMTYEAWIRTTDSKSRSDILSLGNTVTSNVVVEFRASLGKLEFGINDGGWVSLISNASINDGEWHHVAASKNGSSITLYVDGVLDNTGTVGGSPSVNQTDIGVLYNGGTREPDSYFTGDLEEIRVWSDVRTQAEIQAYMHKELTGSEGNLLAYYQMSDGSGTSLTDNSTNSYTGTIANAPIWKTSGALAGPRMALDFDGVNDYFFAPLNATATSSITVEGWFSFNSLTNQQNLMNIHRTTNNLIRFVPYKTAANQIALYVYDGSGTYVVTSTFIISQTNVWHHLAFIYDAGTISIYANGALVGSATGQGSFSTAATNRFSVGADYNGVGAGLYANIKADEVRIWSDVRTQAEILAYKDRTLDGDEANLLSYYRCDQQPSSGQTTVYDYSSNGHNGTLTNMTPATDWVAAAPFNT
ncbi:MAG: LamG domain-containing protein [Bacteroidia bacterium]|nr:LamG domain-containing protein [Bacteroidia bacterium]